MEDDQETGVYFIAESLLLACYNCIDFIYVEWSTESGSWNLRPEIKLISTYCYFLIEYF